MSLHTVFVSQVEWRGQQTGGHAVTQKAVVTYCGVTKYYISLSGDQGKMLQGRAQVQPWLPKLIAFSLGNESAIWKKVG